jgi:hypothetical protein
MVKQKLKRWNAEMLKLSVWPTSNIEPWNSNLGPWSSKSPSHPSGKGRMTNEEGRPGKSWNAENWNAESWPYPSHQSQIHEGLWWVMRGVLVDDAGGIQIHLGPIQPLNLGAPQPVAVLLARPGPEVVDEVKEVQQGVAAAGEPGLTGAAGVSWPSKSWSAEMLKAEIGCEEGANAESWPGKSWNAEMLKADLTLCGKVIWAAQARR